MIYNNIKRNMDIFKGFMSNLVMDHKKTYDEFNLRSQQIKIEKKILQIIASGKRGRWN